VDAYREPMKIFAMVFVAIFQSLLNAALYTNVGA
jgi:hypothetical protein